MLTNTERQQIVEEVNAGTYGIDEALDDIAAAQKGEEVRKALYAEALVLNREGHAGSTDMIARQQIANLQTSVNGQISTLRTEVGEDIDDLEAALNSGLATQNGKIAAQNATIANVVANYNVEYGSETLWEATGETGLLASGTTATLSKDVSNFDYVDIYSFCGNSNVLDTVPVDAKLQSTQGYALRWVNLSDPGSGSYKAYVRIIETRLHIIGTTLTIDHQVTYRNGEEVNISGAEITQSNRSTYVGELGIMKVVGRKITANTEIEDVRIGADGTEYDSAGQAVRAQIQALESAIPAVDSTLSVQGAVADAKAVGDAVGEVRSQIQTIEEEIESGTGSGLTEDIKQALLQIALKAAYSDTNGETYYQDLYDAFYPPIPATAILLNSDSLSFSNIGDTQQLTATITPSDSTDTVEWESLNTAIATVDSNGTVTAVSSGNTTITATAGEASATCSVVVAGEVQPIWTLSSDNISITGSASYANGKLTVSGINGQIILGSLPSSGIGDKTIVIKFGACSRQGTNHGRLLTFNTGNDGIIYRNTGVWDAYISAWATPITDITDANAISNGTMKVYIDSTRKHIKAYINDVKFVDFTFSSAISNVLRIGSSGNAYYNCEITSVNIYEGEV